MEHPKAQARQSFPWVYNRLRELKFAVESRFWAPSIVTHDYGGHAFRVHINDPLARGWYDHDWERLGEIDLLSANGLRAGALVFDIGAHQNVVAMMLAKEAGPGGKVIAVEGARHNCDIGSKNVALNGIGNIETLHAVVAETEGEILFSESLNGSVSVSRDEFLTSAVRAVTIDGLARDYGTPDVVFLDVEGHEIAALKGAAATLRSAASWFIEVHGDETLSKYGARNADILSFFPGPCAIYYRSDEAMPFERLQGGASVPGCRFFLIVIPAAAKQ